MKEITKTIYTCNMCGKEFTKYDPFDYGDDVIQVENEKGVTVVYEWELSRPDYGSSYDGCDVEDIHICDDCFREFIEKMKINPVKGEY